MTRGRKRKPTALKRLAGNPGKRALPKNEPAPPADTSLIAPPKWLDKVAAAEWRRLAATLFQLGLLTNVDRGAFEALCKAYSRWRQAEEIVEKTAEMEFESDSGNRHQLPQVSIALRYMQQYHSLCAEFGFTPASRSRVGRGAEGQEDDFEKFMKGRPETAPHDGAHASSRSLH